VQQVGDQTKVTSNEATIAYFKIISNSSFTKIHPNIRRHIIWATDSVVKYIIDKQKAI